MRLASVTPSLPSSSKLSALLQPTLPKTEWMPSLSELTWWWGEGEGAHWVGGRGGKGESEEHGRGREPIHRLRRRLVLPFVLLRLSFGARQPPLEVLWRYT